MRPHPTPIPSLQPTLGFVQHHAPARCWLLFGGLELTPNCWGMGVVWGLALMCLNPHFTASNQPGAGNRLSPGPGPSHVTFRAKLLGCTFLGAAQSQGPAQGALETRGAEIRAGQT